MLKTNKAQLQSLIIISLSSYIFNANALDTVSSYESSLTQNAQSTSEVNSGNLNQANYNMDQLADELENRGWIITKENDGTLLLNPKVSSKNNTTNETSDVDQWQQVQQKFNKAGWTVKRDPDGSLRLIPQQKQAAEAITKKATKGIKTPAQSKNNSFLEMQTQLREKGWDITNNSDGSILLYPPEQTSATLPKPCYGSATTIDIDLPVNTWQEAHDVAQGWLHNNSINDASVGKIRKIINIYIISIVANTTPHTLKYQIAIRSHDGAVILLN